MNFNKTHKLNLITFFLILNTAPHAIAADQCRKGEEKIISTIYSKYQEVETCRNDRKQIKIDQIATGQFKVNLNSEQIQFKERIKTVNYSDCVEEIKKGYFPNETISKFEKERYKSEKVKLLRLIISDLSEPEASQLVLMDFPKAHGEYYTQWPQSLNALFDILSQYSEQATLIEIEQRDIIQNPKILSEVIKGLNQNDREFILENKIISNNQLPKNFDSLVEMISKFISHQEKLMSIAEAEQNQSNFYKEQEKSEHAKEIRRKITSTEFQSSNRRSIEQAYSNSSNRVKDVLKKIKAKENKIEVLEKMGYAQRQNVWSTSKVRQNPETTDRRVIKNFSDEFDINYNLDVPPLNNEFIQITAQLRCDNLESNIDVITPNYRITSNRTLNNFSLEAERILITTPNLVDLKLSVINGEVSLEKIGANFQQNVLEDLKKSNGRVLLSGLLEYKVKSWLSYFTGSNEQIENISDLDITELVLKNRIIKIQTDIKVEEPKYLLLKDYSLTLDKSGYYEGESSKKTIQAK
jgi:hypothetical protein